MSLSNLSEAIQLPPLAKGMPISEQTADEATEWLTLLMSGEVSDDDRQRWQSWRIANPDNERAWQHIEAVVGRLKLMDPGAARHSLLTPLTTQVSASSGRRKAMRVLLWGSLAGATGTLATHTQTWQQAVADYRTGIGEQRSVTLEDGTRLTLNTGSAVNVRFDGASRRVHLIAGEIMIVTGHRQIDGSNDPRPFIVESAQGHIRALGTRFSVRQWDGRTAVAVWESAVEISPLATGAVLRVVHAGQRTLFSRSHFENTRTVDETDAAWLRGQIVADNIRLGDFISDLARYRPGILRCDPAIADLRFSGVFPLDDIDRIFTTLPNVLPVKVLLRTRYWVTVLAEN